MSEYIRKQAAIDTLAEQIALCDKALKSFEISMKDEYAVKVERASLIAYKEQLEAITAADVVPVVRCKDCKYNATTHKCLNLDSFFLIPKDDDFCSYGERRGEQNGR